MPKIKRRNSTPSDKIKVKFDVELLNSLIKYLRCEYVSQSCLSQLRKFIKYVDIDAYEYEEAIYPRLKTLDILTRIISEEGIRDENLIRTYLNDEYSNGLSVIDQVGFEKNQLSSTECDFISNAVRIRVQTIAISMKKNEILDTLEKIDASSFSTSYYQLVETIRKQMTELITELQVADNDQGLMKEFAFSMKDAAALIDKIVKKAKRPASVLQTGIRQLNAILSPGFQSGRMYCFLGGSGKFKSGTLLNIAEQIRRFNPQIPAYENGLRKCILFITLENSIEETVERIYDMYCEPNGNIRDDDTQQVIDALRNNGGYDFTATSGIDIFMKYAGNLEINTGEIHVYMKELREKGYMPICIILDYIKRIDSVHNSNGDERVRMSFVAKELKAIAQYYEIPLITAMQLNREGNSIIDAAMRESKQDVARFVGSSSIGNAWDIIEDSDWVCLINPEIQISTGQKFLTFKRLKIRVKSEATDSGGNVIDYFNHPFEIDRGIKLQTDVDKDHTVSLMSLATDLESIEEKETEYKELPKRPSLDDVKNSSKGKVLSSLGIHLTDNSLNNQIA